MRKNGNRHSLDKKEHEGRVAMRIIDIRNLVFCSLFFGLQQYTAIAATGESSLPIQPVNEMIMLTVDKAALQADLRTLPENPLQSRVLGTFKIAFGKELGDKAKEGDNRTPEGIYFAQSHIDGSKLIAQKYGPWAIPLDFPNPVDIFHGKTGHGIWLHGAGNDKRIADVNVTEGCVAFYNQDIKKLAGWLEPHQAVVVISNDTLNVNLPQDTKSVLERTRTWIDAWKNRDAAGYISHYADEFQLSGRHKSSYGAYKERVFASYKKMDVDLTQVRVVTHPKYAVSIMNQDFNGDGRFFSNGRKVIFWTKGTDGNWYILREIFENMRFSIPNFTERDIISLNHTEDSHAANGGAAGSTVSKN
jgi:murein L,D-transpeptidase YafK